MSRTLVTIILVILSLFGMAFFIAYAFGWRVHSGQPLTMQRKLPNGASRASQATPVVKGDGTDESALSQLAETWPASKADLDAMTFEQLRRTDGCGGTILHYAVGFGKVDLATYLVNRGLDANATGECGMLPIHSAATPEALDWCVEHGTSVNAADKQFGKTALSFAVSSRNIKLIEHLLNRTDVDVCLTDAMGYSVARYLELWSPTEEEQKVYHALRERAIQCR